MSNLSKRLAALEQKEQAAAKFLVIIYDIADGEPLRDASWPRVVVFIPDNHRNPKTVQTGA